jgi:hypothetical protein
MKSLGSYGVWVCGALLALLPQIAWGDIVLPAPQNGASDDPVLYALHKRASATSFYTAELSPQALSELLWAGFGVNRPAEGNRRTAPSAHNYQDIDIYLATSSGTFRYDAPAHSLELISASDIRASVWGSGSYPATAPVTLVYVSNTATGVNLRQRYQHTGLIAMNVALYCASEDLQVRIQASTPSSLRTALNLTADQVITLVDSIGHSAATNPSGQQPRAGSLVLPRFDDQGVLKALKRRRSHESYGASALSDQTLANILWAGYGINRSGGKRTTPASWFVYNITVYVVTPDGISRYEPISQTEHQLVSVYSGTDARSHLQYSQAPASFVLVSDPSKLSSSQTEFSAVHVGLVASDLLSYCASAGLASKAVQSINDESGLRTKLGIADGQVIELVVSAGAMPNPNPSYSLAFSAGTGGSLTGNTSQTVTLGADATAVTAVPAPGHRFVKWTGTVPGPRTENPLTIRNVVGAMSVSAVFESFPKLSVGDVSVTEGDNGTKTLEFKVIIER